LLYRFDLADRRPVVVNTGFATSNNNDHVLSFDGRTIAISHHSADDHDASIVYTVLVGGGTPRRVTALGPSYLHGWSPDGRFLVYTGERNGEFDVYRIPVDGGEETRLTNTPGLDDGPEYSPDGRYIYFNSVRSGTMQIWRMRPDGSTQQQLTSDQYNNWFPHVSPDGRWIVFLSFMRDVAPDDHPFYKHVYLRLMPAPGVGPPADPELLVKVVPAELSLSVDAAAFEREVLLLGDRLGHAQLVPPRRSGRAGAFVYHARRFVEGTTLRAWLANHGEMPLRRV